MYITIKNNKQPFFLCQRVDADPLYTYINGECTKNVLYLDRQVDFLNLDAQHIFPITARLKIFQCFKLAHKQPYWQSAYNPTNLHKYYRKVVT